MPERPKISPPGRKIRPRNDLHQLVQPHRRIGDQRQRRVDDLGGIMRRNIRRHAHGDAAGAVHQQIREARRQNPRLLVALVVGGLKIHRVPVDVAQQEHRGARQPRLGITHRRRRIAIHRAEIPLPLDQPHPHGPALRHAHQRVVNRGIAVRMEIAHHLADHLGGFAERLVGGVAALLHGVQDSPMHRLQPVARIRQRPADNDRHGIVEVGAPHLLLEHHRLGIGWHAGSGRRILGRIAQLCLVSVRGRISAGTSRIAAWPENQPIAGAV